MTCKHRAIVIVHTSLTPRGGVGSSYYLSGQMLNEWTLEKHPLLIYLALKKGNITSFQSLNPLDIEKETSKNNLKLV